MEDGLSFVSKHRSQPGSRNELVVPFDHTSQSRNCPFPSPLVTSGQSGPTTDRHPPFELGGRCQLVTMLAEEAVDRLWEGSRVCIREYDRAF